jgi:hypothetical protein
VGARAALTTAVASGLLAAAMLAPSASAATFTVSASIPDTTAPSTCSSPCSLRQAIQAAQAEEELAFAPVETTIRLTPGVYVLTQGPLHLEHPWGGSSEHTTTLEGLGGRANEVVITAEGKSRDVLAGRPDGSSGQVVVKRVELTGGDGEGGTTEFGEGEGGAIAVEQSGELSLLDDLVVGNTAAREGGGIIDSGELLVEDTTVQRNQVTAGLGIGGGVDSDNLSNGAHGVVAVVNSTIVEDAVSGGSRNEGAGIYDGTTMRITNSTIAGNSATGSGGALATLAGSPGTTLKNTVIALNSGKDCAAQAPTDDGGNIADDTSCSLTGAKSKQNTSPGLEQSSAKPVLADNEGPTETVALGAGAAADGFGTEANCPAADQRGAPRPSHATCDAGAYQHGSSVPLKIVKGVVTAGSGSITAATQNGPCPGVDVCVLPAEGADVELLPHPASGYFFKDWVGGCEIAYEETGCFLVPEKITKNITLDAEFEALLTVTASTSTSQTTVLASSSGPNSSCTPVGKDSSCSIRAGEPVTLTAATSNPSLRFIGWSGGSCHSENPCTISHVGATEEDTPNYVLGPPNPTPANTLVLYVSASTGSDSNPGTREQPLRTVSGLEHRLEVERHEQEQFPYIEILFAEGNYEGLQFGHTNNLGIAIYGDLNPSRNWEAEAVPTHPTTFTGSPQGLLLTGATGYTFQQVSFRGEAQASGSVYGVREIENSNANFYDVSAEAGNAPNGANGAQGLNGAAGENGTEGAKGHTPAQALCARLGSPGCGTGFAGGRAAGGAGGIDPEHNMVALPVKGGTKQVFLNGGAGGDSGYSDSYLHETGKFVPVCGHEDSKPPGCAEAEEEFTPYGHIGEGGAGENTGGSEYRGLGLGGAGGEGGDRGCSPHNDKGKGESGEPGKSGATGANGSLETAYSDYQGATWNPGGGEAGAFGTPGGGGGGGGAGCGGTSIGFELGLPEEGAGNSGGGGGGGGGAGDGGRAGAGGAGSFGFFITGNSVATIAYGSHATAGNGGNGGSGAGGGSGASGGQGGVAPAYESGSIGGGGNGGSGGSGGGGGGGGGGIGGPSYAIFAGFYLNTGGEADYSPDTVLTAGSPGTGGTSANAGGTPIATAPAGRSEQCNGGCFKEYGLPDLPIDAKVSGNSVITILKCPKSCLGRATLSFGGASTVHLAALSAARRTVTLGSVSFKLKANHTTKLRIPLTAAGRKLVKGGKALDVTLTVELTLGSAKKPTTYTQTLVLVPSKGRIPRAPTHPTKTTSRGF